MESIGLPVESDPAVWKEGKRQTYAKVPEPVIACFCSERTRIFSLGYI